MSKQNKTRKQTAGNNAVEKERKLLKHAGEKGTLATLGTYVKLSGPGWLQSAITLGGGSLAGALYLGILGGASLLWLQPLAMALGIVMLSAIGYVTLSTRKRPFRAINEHVNPVLGWGWAIATLMANLVWALPQFSLATASVRQNVFPAFIGQGVMADNPANLLVVCAICAICISIVWFYDSGSWGIKLFEAILKIMVALIVICFFGVVIKMSMAGSVLDWSYILKGLIPDIKLLTSPAKTLSPFIAQVDEHFRQFWIDSVVSEQRQVMVTAFATAVGINMTFLLPYSMLRRGWDKDFRGLAIFDLSTGLFIPFLLTTGCVVIASAAQFHTRAAPGFLGETDKAGAMVRPDKNLAQRYRKLTEARVKYELTAEAFSNLSEEEKTRQIESLPAADKRLAAMLVRRDAFDLAESLSPLTGKFFSHYIFGIGVVGVATSTIIILMLINGFVVCEMIGVEPKGWPHRLGALLPCIGLLGPFIWTGGKAQFALALPTSMFGMALLPIAYFTFYLLMNKKSLLGDSMPRGARRLLWNILMAVAAGVAAFGSVWCIWSQLAWKGLLLLVSFIALVVVVQIIRRGKNYA